MRDRWFPLALIIVAVFGVALEFLGPLPEPFITRAHQWQSLIAATLAATVASVAAVIAFQNTTRSLAHAEDLERRRRSRKHAALRAMLPLALAAVSDYAERSVHALNELLDRLDGAGVPSMTIPEDLAQPLPTDALKTLADFIEYSDDVDVRVLEKTVAWVQIHDSRMRGHVKDNRNPARSTLVVRHNIESSIIDAASIYAGAGCAYDYARGRSDQMPLILTWDAVRGALNNLRFWDDDHPLYKFIERREKNSAGPFEKLNPGAE